MKREYEEEAEGIIGGGCSKAGSAGAGGGGDDELLAAMGYKVRASEMAQVAHKLEQLEKALGSGADDGISFLGSEAVHYNPSDLSTWLENMLAELNAPAAPADPSTGASSGRSQIYDSDYDLSAIPGEIVLREPKKLKRNSHSASSEPCRPVVLIDSQDTGIRLVHTLMACAEAIQEENLKAADALVKQIGVLAASQAGAMRKVATYFAEALARRIYRITNTNSKYSESITSTLQLHFYESCPYLKFAHFTTNQAILEAFNAKKTSRVHVIDLSLGHGLQWPALVQALAHRPGGPPEFRLTAIGRSPSDEIGQKLNQFAKSIGVGFEFVSYVTEDPAGVLSGMRREEEEEEEEGGEDEAEAEAVAVNAVFELHRGLAREGGVERLLGAVRELRPEVVTVVEQESDHNGGVFVERFTEALHYYSTMYDSLEGTEGGEEEGMVMAEMYLGMEICNVVACEGEERVERHERLARWRERFKWAGFAPTCLGSNAFKQASMLLALFGGGHGYRVEESDGCLTLGWYTRPLIATSAWQVRDNVH